MRAGGRKGPVRLRAGSPSTRNFSLAFLQSAPYPSAKALFFFVITSLWQLCTALRLLSYVAQRSHSSAKARCPLPRISRQLRHICPTQALIEVKKTLNRSPVIVCQRLKRRRRSPRPKGRPFSTRSMASSWPTEPTFPLATAKRRLERYATRALRHLQRLQGLPHSLPDGSHPPPRTALSHRGAEAANRPASGKGKQSRRLGILHLLPQTPQLRARSPQRRLSGKAKVAYSSVTLGKGLGKRRRILSWQLLERLQSRPRRPSCRRATAYIQPGRFSLDRSPTTRLWRS